MILDLSQSDYYTEFSKHTSHTRCPLEFNDSSSSVSVSFLAVHEEEFATAFCPTIRNHKQVIFGIFFYHKGLNIG
jgi:hypothetical protein